MFTKIEQGVRHEERRSFTSSEVAAFSRISGDLNPIHLDDAYAASTVFGQKIVHGMLATSLFSMIIGTRMPGNGTIYLSQKVTFLRPVYHNREYSFVVEVRSIRPDKPIVTLVTQCLDLEKGELVIDGEAIVKVPPQLV